MSFTDLDNLLETDSNMNSDQGVVNECEDESFKLRMITSEEEDNEDSFDRDVRKKNRKRRGKALRTMSSDDSDLEDSQAHRRNKNSVQSQSPSCTSTPSTSTPSNRNIKNDNGSSSLLRQVLANQATIFSCIKKLQKEITEVKTVIQNHQITDHQLVVKVPLQIRNAVREGYSDGLDRDLSWQVEKKRLTDQVNKSMTEYIRTYTLGIHPNVEPAVLNAAIQRYFTSKKESQNRERKNKSAEHRVRQADYERKTEKARRRLLALQKTSLSEEKKAVYKRVLVKKYMSSDEEGPDGGLISRPPSWQSQKFEKLKDILDTEYLNFCSAKSKRLLSKRSRGATKLHTPPDVPAGLKWILKAEDTSSETVAGTPEKL